MNGVDGPYTGARPARTGVDSPLLFRRFLIASCCAATLLGAATAGATVPTRAGIVPPEVSQAFENGLFDLPAPSATPVSSTPSSWRIPIIMVSFTDDTLTYTPENFEFALFDTTHSTPTGSMYDYYQWVSRGRFKVQGQVVANVRLPHDRFYYAYGSWGLNTDSSPDNMWGAVRDALTKCDSLVNWSDFDLDHDGYVDMLWLLHAGVGGEAGQSRNDFWSITTRMSAGWRYGGPYILPQLVPGSTTQHMRIDRFSSVPELSMFHPGQRSEIGVFCHEFGHALGLPDLYDTSQLGGAANMGPGDWSLMSSGAYGTNGYTPEKPSSMDAWSLLFLGWAPSITPSDDSPMLLRPLEQGGPVIQFWFQGEPSAEHFLIENRERLGFDQYVPSPGLLIYHVDEAAIGVRLAANRINAGLTPGLQVVEADGNFDLTHGVDRGDAGDPFPGSEATTTLNDDTSPSTRTFSGAVTNMGLSSILLDGTSARFQMQVRAPGWLGIEDHTDAQFSPAGLSTAGVSAAVDTFGTITEVASESRAGVPQIVLRERRQGVWSSPVTLSQSSLGADEPTLAQLPNGDLGVAWRDLRDGIPGVYYRARIRGAWAAEQRVGNVPANSFQPAIACDAQGWMYLAWLTAVNSRPQVMTMKFPYLSPFGTAIALTDSAAYPDAPSIVSGPSGRGYILWPERALYPQVIRFVRFRPDSSPTAYQQLAPVSPASQIALAAVMGQDETLHTIWQEVGNGDATLHYQKRWSTGNASLPDTTIEMASGGILGPTLALDREGGLHVAYETTKNGTQEIRYKNWTLSHHWDFVSTEVTRESDGGARQPRVVATAPQQLTVLFTGYPAGQPRFMTRDRRLGPTLITAAPQPAPEIESGLALGPNPLRAGGALELRWSGDARTLAAGPMVDLFDVSGRRLAALPLAGTGTTRFARISSSTTATWPAGLYFARLRGSGAATRLVVLR